MLIALLSGCELLTIKPMVPCRDTLTDTSGLIDTGPVQWYPDLDGDGYGEADAGQDDPGAEGTWVSVGGDCDDSTADVFPGAPELCDGVINDCDTAETWQQEVSEAGLITWQKTDWSWESLTWSGSVSFSEEGIVWLCPDDSGLSVNLTLSSPGTLILRTRGPDSRASAPVAPSILHSAAAEQPVVTVTGGEVYLELVELTGASSSGDGGGLLISGGSVRLIGSKLYGNTAGRGGGLFISGGSLVAQSVSLNDNTADSGGGLYAEDSALDLAQVHIHDNDALSGEGGGAVLIDTAAVGIDLGVRDNTASTVGGGFYQEGGEVRCSQTTLEGNTSQGSFQGNSASGVHLSGVRLESGTFISGSDGEGCWFEQSVWTPGGGDYLPSDPFVFTCDESGCSE